MKRIPLHLCHKIYDILVGHTGAPENSRRQFVLHYGTIDNDHKPTEYRICNRWGMAGKFWWNNERFYVSGRSRGECSDEVEFQNECEETNTVNALLAPLCHEFYQHRIRSGYLEAIPSFAQHQGSVTDQLKLLILVANKIGLQDAADFILNATVEKPRP